MHLVHLEALSSAQATYALAIYLEKGVFAVPTPEIFEHTISAAGLANRAHCSDRCLPPPQDIKQLQHFLGMVNFYRRFLPGCAHVCDL
jgi:putative transposase